VRDLVRLVAAELLKLRRTLALALVLVAPALVVALQVVLFLNNRRGFDYDVDLWPMFFTSLLAIWAVFMLPLATALQVALLYAQEHAHNGWQRLYTLPVPRGAIVVSKQTVSLLLHAAASVALVPLAVLGGRVLDLLHPNLEMPAEVPWGLLLERGAGVAVGALLLVAIQNWTSFRSQGATLPIGVGVAGTLVAVFASGWRRGWLYPWLIPLRLTNPDYPHWNEALLIGGLGGLLVLGLAAWDGARREISG
jgi:ABC-2 type transport system permease protein